MRFCTELAGDNALEQAKAAMIVACVEDATKPLAAVMSEKDDAKKVRRANQSTRANYCLSLS